MNWNLINLIIIANKDTPLDNFIQNLVGEAVQNPSVNSEVQFSMSDILPSSLDNFYRYKTL